MLIASGNEAAKIAAGNYELLAHEAADIFPLDEENTNELAADIKTNGLRVPIETLDGKILDGRRRYKACQIAGITPHYRKVMCADPVAYVLSLNLHRRHLDTSQRAMVGDKARELWDRKAKDRQRAAGGNKALVANLPQAPAGVVPSSPEQTEQKNGTARDHAGAAVNVSGRLMDAAKKVRTEGVPELAKAVEEGSIAVSTAAVIATKPPDVQKAEIQTRRNGRVTGGCSEQPPDLKERILAAEGSYLAEIWCDDAVAQKLSDAIAGADQIKTQTNQCGLWRVRPPASPVSYGNAAINILFKMHAIHGKEGTDAAAQIVMNTILHTWPNLGSRVKNTEATETQSEPASQAETSAKEPQPA